MDSPSGSGRRCRYPLLSALVMLTMHGQCQALVSPQHQHQLSRPGPTIHHEVQYHYRRRKRNILELHLHSHSISGLDGSHSHRHRSLSNNHPSFLSHHVTPSIVSSQNNVIHRAFSTSTSASSLHMAQNRATPESANGFGKGGDDKHKRSGGASNKNNKNSSPKSKANKGNVVKGTASSSSGNNKSASNANANADDDRPKQKPKKNSDRAKRPKKRRNNNKGSKKNNNNKFNNNKHKKGKKRQKKSSSSTTKTTKTVPHGESILNTDKSSIKTNDENTSLKGFKTEQQVVVVPEKKKQKDGDNGTFEKDGTANNNDDKEDNDEPSNAVDTGKRVVQLEMIVSKQSAEIQKLRREIEELTKASKVFSNVINVLREAGLRIEDDEEIAVTEEESENEDDDSDMAGSSTGNGVGGPLQMQAINDDMEIFGIAPKCVTDAADAAGASILAAILAGKHRMLVDVRDAELTRDPKLFVEFIELAILPVAAGLEGLDGDGDEYVRNRVKIVFPTVKELMSYRRSMALAAPEVVSLSTLGFDPVDERDNLIVVVAPSPDDIAGVMAMEKLLARTDQNYIEPELRITQPVVVLNHHMVPIDMADMGVGKFTVVYHLRLLSVQYMTGDATPEYVAKQGKNKAKKVKGVSKTSEVDNDSIFYDSMKEEEVGRQIAAPSSSKDDGESPKAASDTRSDEEDEALEAAMTHAHEIGVHQGVTRAMVIRAYPKPWHVFVDTSPDTDADFEVAATFDGEPTQEDVNYAIVECLEGGENEDEIVAQQMQAALEAGQLNRVSDMLGISPFDIVPEDKTANTDDSSEENTNNDDKPYDGNDWDDLYYDDWFSEDSV